MSEMLLLGAGASVASSVPDTYAMTRKIAEVFQDEPQLRRYLKVISFVAGGLLFQQGIRGKNPINAGVNVEELFNSVQLLAERDKLEFAFKPTKALTSDYIFQWATAQLYSGFGQKIADSRLTSLQQVIHGQPTGFTNDTRSHNCNCGLCRSNAPAP